MGRKGSKRRWKSDAAASGAATVVAATAAEDMTQKTMKRAVGLERPVKRARRGGGGGGSGAAVPGPASFGDGAPNNPFPTARAAAVLDPQSGLATFPSGVQYIDKVEGKGQRARDGAGPAAPA